MEACSRSPKDGGSDSRPHRVRSSCRSLRSPGIVFDDGSRARGRTRRPGVCWMSRRRCSGRISGIVGHWRNHGLHFKMPSSGSLERLIHLNGSGSGEVNLVCSPSSVAPGYVEDGWQSMLVSLKPGRRPATGLDLDALREEAGVVMGMDTSRWEHVSTTFVPAGLPAGDLTQLQQGLPDGVVVAGDWTGDPSIEQAVRAVSTRLIVSLPRSEAPGIEEVSMDVEMCPPGRVGVPTMTHRNPRTLDEYNRSFDQTDQPVPTRGVRLDIPIRQAGASGQSRPAMKMGDDLFPGVLGYENSVVPEIINGILAGHDMLFGEKGQAKSRLMRLMVRFSTMDALSGYPRMPRPRGSNGSDHAGGSSAPREHGSFRYPDRLVAQGRPLRRATGAGHQVRGPHR